VALGRTEPLGDEEMEEILVGIARNSSSAIARIQAVKVLRSIRAESGGKAPPDEWAKVYEMTEARRSGRRPRLASIHRDVVVVPSGCERRMTS
jgi:hypothetical protein